MPNLKPYYDAALAADTEVKRILADMDVLFNNGTEEGKQKALELRPALDEAKVKAESANALYVSMRDASLTNDKIGALFSSPADPGATSDEKKSKDVMKRADWLALNHSDRAAFIKGGGTLED